MTRREAASDPEAGIQVTTLVRLWKAARSLSRIRAAAAPSPVAHDPAAEDPPLWGAHPFRILDIRSAQAFGTRHIPESASIPAAEVRERIYELPPKWRPLVVVSDLPEEAQALVPQLRERGWRNCLPLIESLRGWPGPWESGPARRILWEPTPLVRRWAARIPPGAVLDLGCGSGRDAVYLAMLGCDVTAIDLLPDALAMAESLATRMGVSLTTQAIDLRRDRPPTGAGYAAILMLRYLNRKLFGWIRDALRPGGLFLFETFTHEQAQRGTPRAPCRALAPQEALRGFSGSDAAAFEILEYCEGPDSAGQFVARLVARKAEDEAGPEERPDR